VENEVCKVIHNGVNTRLFRPFDKKVCRKQLGIADDYFYIGFVGSFKAWQGLEPLIEAMKIVTIKGYDRIKCLFIGDGYLMNPLREMVSRYALNNEIIFKGRIAYKNIPGAINSFDICVAPFKKARNQKIGLSPLKLYEYLACAKPVIASRVAGVSEVIEKGNCGYLFDPDDVESLSSRIIESYQERDKLPELGKNGRRFIKDQFSWEKVAESVQSVLLEAIEQNQKSMVKYAPK
jgi:glycosyltransferase involved in cell wall biosynthesis